MRPCDATTLENLKLVMKCVISWMEVASPHHVISARAVQIDLPWQYPMYKAGFVAIVYCRYHF